MLYTSLELIMESQGDITRVLKRLGLGDKSAESELIQLVYSELHRIAVGKLRRERPGHTLQPTALVNETYLKMMGKGAIKWENRAHFFGAAACAMRRILVDHARGVKAQRRGGGQDQVELTDALAISYSGIEEILVSAQRYIRSLSCNAA